MTLLYSVIILDDHFDYKADENNIFPWIIYVDHAEWKDVNSALKNISPSISPPVFLFCAPFSNIFIPHSYCTNLKCSLKSVLYRFLHYVLILFDRTILQSNYGLTYRVLQSTSYSVVLIFIYLNDYRIIWYCDIIKLQCVIKNTFFLIFN